MEQASEQVETRNPDGTYKSGVSGNPGGRPRNTLKDYVARKFSTMSDEEKEQWLKDHNVSAEIIWRMGEGNPKQDTELHGNLTISDVLDDLENGRSKTPEQRVED